MPWNNVAMCPCRQVHLKPAVSHSEKRTMEDQEGCYQMLKPLTFIETERKKNGLQTLLFYITKDWNYFVSSSPKKLYFVFSSSEPGNRLGKIVISHKNTILWNGTVPALSQALSDVRQGEGGWGLFPTEARVGDVTPRMRGKGTLEM